MPPPPLPITSRQIREIYLKLCENADAYHAATDLIASEAADSCEETLCLVHTQYGQRVAELLRPLTVSVPALPLLHGTALNVPKATELRRRQAEVWNATLLQRVAAWWHDFPATCGAKFHNVITAFAHHHSAEFWLQHRHEKQWIDELSNSTPPSLIRQSRSLSL